MQLLVNLHKIQHVNSFQLNLDLSKNCLTCIVGKNGVGKTTVIKSILNLKSSDTFLKTSQPGIFKTDSSISYTYNKESYSFIYDKSINTLNSHSPIPEDLRSSIEVELPMPFGQRFNHFQNISSADRDIRSAIMLQEYTTPTELISFLNDIYSSDKFNNLKEVKVKKTSYYCIPLDDDRYVREDHLSSGEFFLICLYRKIKSSSRLIIIDEIDISLDAAAQAHLIKWLREFCKTENVNIVFTTHSLALMRTLESDELYYMEETNGETQIIPASYNYIKSILFGFKGWDKYILTEDLMLKGFLQYILTRYCRSIFYAHQIIPVGGGENVVQLMKQNEVESFFSAKENVISILDGDQSDLRHARHSQVYCIPFESVEKKVFEDYLAGLFLPELDPEPEFYNAKRFYKKIIKDRVISNEGIFEYLCNNYNDAIRGFSSVLTEFLT